MKRAVILRGASGSGKTEILKRILNSFPRAVSVSADDYFKDGYHWTKELAEHAHKSCRDKFRAFVRSGAPLIFVDNTNIRSYEYSFYAFEAIDHGYDIAFVRLDCDELTSFNRNIHGLTLKQIARQQRLMDDIPEVLHPVGGPELVLDTRSDLGPCVAELYEILSNPSRAQLFFRSAVGPDPAKKSLKTTAPKVSKGTIPMLLPTGHSKGESLTITESQKELLDAAEMVPKEKRGHFFGDPSRDITPDSHGDEDG